MARRQFVRTDSGTYFLILKRISLDMIVNKYFIILDLIGLLLAIILLILQVLYFIKHWSVELLGNYCNSLCIQLYAIISMLQLVRYKSIIKEIFGADNSLLKTNWLHNENVRKEINERSRFAFLLGTFLFVSSIATFISLTPLRQVSKEYFLYEIFDEYFGEKTLLSQIFYCMAWSTFPFIGYVSSILGFSMLFLVLQFKAQLNLIMDNFSNVPEKYQNVAEIHLFHSQTYQDDMYMKICQLIKDHRHVKSIVQRILDKSEVTATLYLIVGFVTLMSGIYSTLQQYRVGNFQYFTVLVPVAASTLFTSFLYWEGGQIIQDESARCFDAAFNSKWYIWNKKNRQALQLFMLYNLKPQIISVAGLDQIDYSFALKVMKLACSTAITFYQLDI